jgi:hypothetical protein
MAHPIVAEKVVEKQVGGKNVRITYRLHTKDPSGLRTIRIAYLEDMPHKFGGWRAATETEQVVEGKGKLIKTVIPEHRVA